MLQRKIGLILGVTMLVALLATLLYAVTMWLPPAALAAEAGAAPSIP
jgi:hypothetical protein